MTQTPYKLNALPSDLIMDEYDPRYCTETVSISNTTANPITLPLGILCSNTLTLTAAQIAAGTLAGAVGILIKEEHLPAGTTVDLTVLARGPAIINTGKLPTADVAGSTFSAASIESFLSTNFPTILQRNEPTQISQQTT
jgi:hypothetical protein